MTIEKLQELTKLPIEKRIIITGSFEADDNVTPREKRIQETLEYLQSTKGNFDFIRYISSLDKNTFYNLRYCNFSEVEKSYENCEGMLLCQNFNEYFVIPIWALAYAELPENWQEKISLYPITNFIKKTFNYNILIPIEDFKWYLEVHCGHRTLTNFDYITDEQFNKDRLEVIQLWIDNKGKTYQDYYKIFKE